MTSKTQDIKGGRRRGFFTSESASGLVQFLRFLGEAYMTSCPLSQNFLANHQLDIHLWTEFLYTFCRQHCPSRRVCR